MSLNIYKRIRIVSVSVVALLITVSCTHEPNTGGGLYDKEYADFTMQLVPPGSYTPITARSLTTAQQNAITRATVLVYGSVDQTLLYAVKADVSANVLTVKLKSSIDESDLFDVVVISNPPTDLNPTIGRPKAALQAALNSTITGKWTGLEFIMWGERKGILIETVHDNFDIDMLRPLARIDIGAGVYNESAESWAGLSNFVLTEVRVVNARDKFAVIPLPENLAATGKMKVTAPSLPTGVAVQGKTAAEALVYSDTDIQNGTTTQKGAYINSTIFIAEAPNDADRVTLIIGGSYNGTFGYYRVDMCVPKTVGEGYDYLSILRNHRYRITISNIFAAGAATAEEALTSMAMNLKATLLPISENANGGNIVFDGNNYITTNVSEVVLNIDPAGVLPEYLFTVRAGTTSEGVATGTVTGSGISIPIVLSNGIETRVEAVIPIKVSGMRQDVYTYTIKFGALTKTIKVTIPPTAAAIEYNKNGMQTTGSFPGREVGAPNNIVVSRSIPTSNYHSFTRWNTAPTNSGQSYASGVGISVPVGTTLILYAQWSAKEATIAYHNNGVGITNSIPANQRVTLLNAKVYSVSPTSSSHVFINWNTAPAGNGTPI